MAAMHAAHCCEGVAWQSLGLDRANADTPATLNRKQYPYAASYALHQYLVYARSVKVLTELLLTEE